jgi:hypothetical protein
MFARGSRGYPGAPEQALAADSPVRGFFGWLNELAAEAQRWA